MAERSPQEMDQLATQGQANSQSAITARQGTIELMEALIELLALLRCKPDTRIDHLNQQRLAISICLRI